MLESVGITANATVPVWLSVCVCICVPSVRRPRRMYPGEFKCDCIRAIRSTCATPIAGIFI